MLYILLATLTDEGQQKMLADPDMFIDVCEELHVPGTQLLARYAVLGRFDFMLMAEARDDESVARLSMELGARAHIHLETLPTIAVGLLAEPSEPDLMPEFSSAWEPRISDDPMPPDDAPSIGI